MFTSLSYWIIAIAFRKGIQRGNLFIEFWIIGYIFKYKQRNLYEAQTAFNFQRCLPLYIKNIDLVII